MIFKIATFVLSGALVGTLVYYNTGTAKKDLYITSHTYDSTTKSFTEGKTLVTEESIAKLNEELKSYSDFLHFDHSPTLDKWSKDSLDSMAGEPHSIRSAKRKIKRFNDWNQQPWNFQKPLTPYGYAFGIGRIRAMLAAIDSVNNKAKKDRSKMIFGVRVHLAVGDTITNAGRANLDVMLIPVKYNGRSFFDFNKEKESTTNTILNTSSPCPKLCN